MGKILGKVNLIINNCKIVNSQFDENMSIFFI